MDYYDRPFTTEKLMGYMLVAVALPFVVAWGLFKLTVKFIADLITAIWLNFYGRVVAFGGLALFTLFVNHVFQ